MNGAVAPARAGVRKFFNAIKVEDWDEAARVAQRSWTMGCIAAGQDPENFLRSKISPIGIVGFTVRNVTRLRQKGRKQYSRVMVDVEVHLETRELGPLITSVRCIREDDNGRPVAHGDGRWGANPASMFRMKVKPTEQTS